MAFILQSSNETISFDARDIDRTDRDFGFVWIHKCPKGGWPGNYMSQKYMVRDARRIYGELLAKGYVKGN